MKRIVYLLALISLTLSATTALGQCIVRNRVVAAAPAVVATPAIVAPAIIPAYGAGYDNTAGELAKLKEQIAALEARLALVESARDSHNARLAVLEAKSGVLPPVPKPQTAESKTEAKDNSAKQPAAKAAPAGASLPAAFARSCIQCHQAGKSPKGGLILVDSTGKRMAPLTCEQRLELLRRVNLPDNNPLSMPPRGKGDPVSDREAAELLEILTKLK